MEETRWQKIEELFNATLALPPGERPTFLDVECGNDMKLRSELDSLIGEVERADEFLSQPALTLGARVLARAPGEQLSSGEVFAAYTIVKPLGSGGMGSVFLAEDPRLERLIALKLLPVSLTNNEESALRFKQEALAASAISHPNVTHIYEFGQVEDRYYLAMEFVEGKTVRELMKLAAIDLPLAVEIALQVAQTLEAAHKAGVVHRDVKPENIMVRRDGYVKVLDFGLAKITPAENKGEGHSPKSGSSFDTSPGLIMGTTAYMSPEQVRGVEVGAATDIWSLGVVLYEMLSGSLPFAEKTSSDVRAAILLKDPKPLPSQEGVFAQLGLVCKRALNKEAGKRYKSAAELAVELKTIKQQLELGEGGFNRAGNLGLQTKANTSVAVNRDTTPAVREWFGFDPTRSRRLALVILLVVTLGGAFFLWYQSRQRSQRDPDHGIRQTLKVTNSGKAIRSTISGDGDLIAYALEEAGQQGLFVRSVDNASNVTILVQPAAIEFVGIAFSPNAEDVYFGVKQADEVIASLYRIPARGGLPQKLLTDLDSAPSFSPDGRQMVFLRLSEDGSHEDLCLVNIDGSNERTIYTRRMPEFISTKAQPSWSPDGRLIAIAAGAYLNGERKMQLIGLRVADASTEPLTDNEWAEIAQASWLADGSGVVLTGRRQESQDNLQLWRISYPLAAASQLSNDFNDYSGVSLSRDGKNLITLAGSRTANLWITDVDKPDESAQQISFGNNDGYGLAWMPGDRIVYGSDVSGNPDIWVTDKDGGHPQQLTTDEHADTDPAVSPDGRHIVFVSTRNNGRHIWFMDAAGQNQRQLTEGTGESTPVISSDGRFVLYYSFTAGIGSLWKMSLNDGSSAVIETGTPRYPALSYNDKWLAMAYRPQGTTSNKIGIVPFDDPSVTPRVLDPVSGARSPGPLKWTRDGQAITYIVAKHGVSNIWKQPLDATAATQITRFNENRIYGFDWSSDGRRIVSARGDLSSHVVLFKLN